MGNVHIHINTGGASSPAQKKPSSASKAGNGNAAPQRAKATGLGAATRPQQQAQPAYPQSQMGAAQMPTQPPQAPVVPTPSRASTPSGVANKKNTKTPASTTPSAPTSVSPRQTPKASSPAATKGKSTSSVKKAASPSSSTSSSSSSSSGKSSSGSSKSASKANPPAATKASATPKAQAKTLGMQQQQGITPAGPPQAGSLLGGNGGNFMPGAGQLPPTASSPQPTQGAQNMKPPVAKSPGKEPKAPPDVETARDQQDTVLRQRQAREVQGRLRGGPRDVDAGSGFWPPMTPVL